MNPPKEKHVFKHVPEVPQQSKHYVRCMELYLVHDNFINASSSHRVLLWPLQAEIRKAVLDTDFSFMSSMRISSKKIVSDM